MPLQIKVFDGESFKECEEKFNWHMSNYAPQVVNLIVMQPRFPGQKHEIVLVYDDKPKVQTPIMIPPLKGRA